jgi:eukaryotic-like serine/threonine-protein kinase
VRVGEALSLAHAKGIVHRDVKPANILLDEHGAPKLTDFDLVAVADTTGGTRTGAALGTLLYAAPESLDRPQDADARADVYGLGMTAVFCLSGAELPKAILREPEPVLGGLPCSKAVRGVLRKAIAWERDERFGDVAELCAALDEAALGGGWVNGAPQAGATEKRWWRVGVMALVVLAVMLGLSAVAWRAMQGKLPERRGGEVERVATSVAATPAASRTSPLPSGGPGARGSALT